jgi:hypothetical protein
MREGLPLHAQCIKDTAAANSPRAEQLALPPPLLRARYTGLQCHLIPRHGRCGKPPGAM